MKGKNVCRIHGGKSTGPKTKAGKERCAAAKTVHGRETRAKRAEYRAKMKELYELEKEMRRIGMIEGSWVCRKTRGSA